MKNSLFNAAVAAVFGAIAALVVVFTGWGPFGGGRPQDKYATIELYSINGTCYIHTDLQYIRQGKNGNVFWSIDNRCGGETGNAEVTIFFKGQNPCSASDVLHDKRRIKCKVRGDALETGYLYGVSAPGALTEDPELEVA